MVGLVPFKFNNGVNYKGALIDNIFQDFFNDEMLSQFYNVEQLKTDIKETDNEYVIQAELPGIQKEDISLDYNNDYLTIKAVRNYENEDNKDNFIRKERHYGEFSRSFFVSNIDKSKINAKFQDGMLNITLPKKEHVTTESNYIPIE